MPSLSAPAFTIFRAVSLSILKNITTPLSINNNTIQSSSYQCHVNFTNNVAYTGDAQAYRQNRHSCVYFTNDIDNEINIYDIINDKDCRGIERRAIAYIKTMNIDKNIYKWAVALVKYGDVYIKLYRNSEYIDPLFKKENVKRICTKCRYTYNYRRFKSKRNNRKGKPHHHGDPRWCCGYGERSITYGMS